MLGHHCSVLWIFLLLTNLNIIPKLHVFALRTVIVWVCALFQKALGARQVLRPHLAPGHA